MDSSSGNLEIFSRNLQRAGELWQEFLLELAETTPAGGAVAATQQSAAQAFSEWFTAVAEHPEKWLEAQTGLWREYAALLANTTARMLGEGMRPLVAPDARDRRFKDETWNQHPLFDLMKQSYLLFGDWLQRSIGNVDSLPPQTVRKLRFYTRQWLDALAPTNFLLTNPEVVRKTMVSNAENLVKGMENLLADLRGGQGHMKISLTDESAFAVGKDLALTAGKVVFRNDLMELIQYAPATKNVYKTPLLIVPAWINKFYILDMRPENSFVKWLTEQGHTVFMISWVNPSARLAGKTFADYMREGPLAAMDAIAKQTGEKTVNVMAYCLGGTLTACALAYLAAKKQAYRVASVTYLTTLVDFSEPGDLGVFIDERQLAGMEEQLKRDGYLDGRDMAFIFSLLRANDLIWSAVVNNYLLGKEPFPFDLLYWNSDSTRMPAAMHLFYLRSMYLYNLLTKPGGIRLADVPVDLSRIKTPSYILSTAEDHIAPWKTTYLATRLYKGPVRFVLSGSGHVAGVINPPEKKKYGYRAAGTLPAAPEAWLKAAKEYEGSWWEDWQRWAAAFAGPELPARDPAAGPLKPLCSAPGEYVKVG